MNFTKTALVLAMAGIVSVPMAAQASAGDGAYASIRIGVSMKETNGGEGKTGGTEATNVGNAGSRFGFKSETDLGNGMSAFGKFEWAVKTEGTSNADPISRRHAIVGLKGDFGSVTLGQTNQTFYKHVVGPNDMPWNGSGFAMIKYAGRQSGISYAGSTGAASFGITAIMNDSAASANGNSEAIDELQLGFSYDAGIGKFGVAMMDTKSNLTTAAADADAIIGLALSGVAVGPVSLGLGYQSQDVVNTTRTKTSTLIDLGYNSFYFHYESLDQDDSTGTIKHKVT